ncbi:MAG: DASS family sodium-coupled anion symporter [Firmicutes bacterium]|nr:DASS family sodium-coupled anion symporter [Bacillota bacterium]
MPALRQRLGLILGPALFLLVALFLHPPGMSPQAALTLAVTLWMATWWVTEPVPLSVTSLLPIVLFPALGLAKAGAVTANYGDPVIFLFLGGFLLSIAFERWNLHRRIALGIISVIGTSPSRLLLGFLCATAFISMWISNTATAMMMLPIATAVVRQVTDLTGRRPAPGSGEAASRPEEDGSRTSPPGRPGGAEPALKTNFGAALMLSVAWASSIGGVGTLIGTPPNAVFAAVASNTLGVQVRFVQWMLYGVPLAASVLLLAWALLLWLLPPEIREIPGGREVIRQQLSDLGPVRPPERRVALVFALVSLAWVVRPWLVNPFLPQVDDTVIAIAGALLLFLLPAGGEERQHLLEAEDLRKVPWGILLLFGGGLALAEVFESSGLSEWVAGQLAALRRVGFVGAILAVATLVTFLTEFTSNTAIASLFLPLTASLGTALDVPPLALMATASISSSLGFMLPAGTPPNAIVYGSGHLTIGQMVKTGFWLNLISILVTTLFSSFWLPRVWGLG